MLRHQLTVLGRQIDQPALNDDDYDLLLTDAGFVDLERHNDMGATPNPDMSIITATAG